MRRSPRSSWEGDHLDDETRSLLRALLLCSIIQHRAEADPTEHLTTSAERALARLETKTFGACDDCRSSITLDVLLLAPEVQRCAACLEAPSRARGGWRWLPGRGSRTRIEGLSRARRASP
jgi:RNA polymerase-binding transcription factor DksA